MKLVNKKVVINFRCYYKVKDFAIVMVIPTPIKMIKSHLELSEISIIANKK
jgi:hypothetical protein